MSAGFVLVLFAILFAPPSPAAADTAPPVVVVAMSGVGWHDASAATPALSSLLRDGATANLVPRSVGATSCPIDGWLAISSGSRAAAPGECRPPQQPKGGTVPDWPAYQQAVRDQPYDAQLGRLGQTLRAASVSAAALGPGAAIALADPSGSLVGQYAGPADDPAQLAAALPPVLTDVELTVIDIGSAAGGLAALDDRLAAVLDAVRSSRPEAVVLVASIADGPPVVAGDQSPPGDEPREGTESTEGDRPPAGLQIAALLDPAAGGPRSLGSPSTRLTGLAQATDLAPTILQLLGLTPPVAMAGAPMEIGQQTPDPRAGLVDDAQHARAVTERVAGLYDTLVVLGLAVCGAGWLALRRGGSVPAPALLVVGALPAASFLANLLPWWRSGSPAWAYLGSVVAAAVAVTVLALNGPWRRSRWGPPTCLAVVTEVTLLVGVLGVDAVQYAAPMGISPLVGGRFYGFGNSAFALHATAALVIAAAAADRLARRGQRRRAAVVVAAVGAVAVVADGHPSFGADFGGPPALLPAFGVLAVLALGVRLTAARIALVIGISALAAVSLSVLDWLRPPPERSHLGRFVQTVLDGELGSVLARKVEQNFANLTGSTLTLLAIAGTLLLIAMVRPRLATVANAPMLRPLVVALGIAWAIGFAVNDSGVLVPAVGMMLGIPVILGLLAAQPARSTAASAAIV
ncbi:hypothetical protein EK0264_14315 [Epidermidibacterium keratini]|uniref:Alkaline phosphatase family protein n=1 Tax=Epidermidibacterium keratini TaxID=1891644 RepID=A0A7L4YPZ0_9ACTN|nr:hypothetical protein [Epidermidibacterium keratini]QHC01341.1 hypothetical protein EK0264_14315 [Epidermidibacterium keratini]